MPKQTLNNGENNGVIRRKINDNFTELYETSKTAYEIAIANGYLGDEISFNLALASIGQDLTRVPVTITVTRPDGTPFANMPVSIFASGGAAQSTVLNENGQFTRGFIPERDYTIRVIRQPGDEFFNTSVNFSTGTLDLPTEISFRVVHGSLYADPTELDEIWRVAALTDDSQTDRSVSTFGSPSGTTKWIGGVLAPNGKIYGIPSHTTTVLEIDPDTRTTSTFGSISGTAKYRSGAYGQNGKIYGIPCSATTVLEIDPDTQTTSTFGSFSSGQKWYGGALAPNGKIYGIPTEIATVLEIGLGSDPDENLSGNALLSGWINKL